MQSPAGQIALHPIDPDVVAIATADESVRLTRDGGSTWEIRADAGAPATELAAAE